MRLHTPSSPDVDLIADTIETIGVNEMQEIIDDDLVGEFHVDEESSSTIEDEEELEELDLSIVTFKQDEPIFSAKFNPSAELVATGGQDDKAFVWDAKTGEMVLECVGHNESVVETVFNHDGTYLATADMNGCVKIWKMATYTLHDEYTTGSEITWLHWHPSSNVIFAGCKNGDVYMWRIPMIQFKILFGKDIETQCGILLPDAKRLAVGYNDGSVGIWDLKSAKILYSYKHGSESCVNCIDAHNDNSLIVAGFEAGYSVLIKSTNGAEVGVLTEGNGTIEAVKFSKGAVEGILAVARANSVFFWDVARQVVRNSVRLLPDDSVSRMIWSINGFLYVGGTLDGMVYAICGRSGQMVQVTGHSDSILDITLSKNYRYLLTASDDCSAKIFELV